jgi:four helix bundle protein
MTTSQDKSQQLEKRMMDFSLDIIRLCKQANKSQENQIITNQLIRSATSIGANYAEAINAASKQDFRNKIFISKKEAAETRYWLRLFARVNEDIDSSAVEDESSQLLFILQKIISTLKNGK